MAQVAQERLTTKEQVVYYSDMVAPVEQQPCEQRANVASASGEQCLWRVGTFKS